jgi:hypothetical protein
MVSSWLRDRDPDANTFDALRAGITSLGGEPDPSQVREKQLRGRLIRENTSLAAHSEHLQSKFAELLAEAVAKDLGDEPDDLRPRLVAAATAAAIGVIGEMADDEAEHQAETFESVLAFLRGGLAAMQDQARG